MIKKQCCVAGLIGLSSASETAERVEEKLMPFTNTIKEPKKTVSVLMEERYVVSRKKYLGSWFDKSLSFQLH